MHGGEAVDDSPMLVRQGVTQQATHGRSLPSQAALEEGNSRPQGQLGGGEGGEVGSGEEEWDMGRRKEVNIQTEHIQYEHSLPHPPQSSSSIFLLNPPPISLPPLPSPHPPPSSYSQKTTHGFHGKLLTLAGGELLKVLEGEGALGGEPQAGGMMERGLED